MDSLVVVVIRWWANSKFGRYGRMLDLSIDSKHKTVRAEVQPKGETTPIVVTANYEVIQTGGEAKLHLHGIRVDREWLSVLANELLGGQTSLPLPAGFAALARVLL
jgi:hypothetical protein